MSAPLPRRGAGWYNPPDSFDDRHTRVLIALVAAHQAQGRATVRAVARRVGLPTMTTHAALMRLRIAGLVDWQDRAAGTLRPIVEVVR